MTREYVWKWEDIYSTVKVNNTYCGSRFWLHAKDKHQSNPSPPLSSYSSSQCHRHHPPCHHHIHNHNERSLGHWPKAGTFRSTSSSRPRDFLLLRLPLNCQVDRVDDDRYNKRKDVFSKKIDGCLVLWFQLTSWWDFVEEAWQCGRGPFEPLVIFYHLLLGWTFGDCCWLFRSPDEHFVIDYQYF